MNDADCTPGREPRSVAASHYYLHLFCFKKTAKIVCFLVSQFIKIKYYLKVSGSTR